MIFNDLSRQKPGCQPAQAMPVKSISSLRDMLLRLAKKVFNQSMDISYQPFMGPLAPTRVFQDNEFDIVRGLSLKSTERMPVTSGKRQGKHINFQPARHLS